MMQGLATDAFAAAPALGLPLLGLVAGALLGLAHFGSLWWNTHLYVTGGPIQALGIQILRLGLLFAVLVVLAKLGAPTLIAGGLGLLLARGFVLRHPGRLSWARR